MIKKIILLLMYLTVAILLIRANEFMADDKNMRISAITNTFSFNFSDINKFDDDNKNDEAQGQKKLINYLYMGYLGLGFSALGTLTTGIGIIFISEYSWTGNVSFYLLYSGGVLFIVGLCFVAIALPFMIAGFVLYAQTKKKMNLFIDSKEEKKYSFGFTINL